MSRVQSLFRERIARTFWWSIVSCQSNGCDLIRCPYWRAEQSDCIFLQESIILIPHLKGFHIDQLPPDSSGHLSYHSVKSIFFLSCLFFSYLSSFSVTVGHSQAESSVTQLSPLFQLISDNCLKKQGSRFDFSAEARSIDEIGCRFLTDILLFGGWVSWSLNGDSPQNPCFFMVVKFWKILLDCGHL